MKTITVERMEMYYSFFENVLNEKQIDDISLAEISQSLNIPLSEVEDDIGCICNTHTIGEKQKVRCLLKSLQNILCSFRYTNNCIKYFLPENSRFVYA